ncbi:hypothetical protein ABPG72_003750 [Tetrahymena utriculariae]
MSTLSGYITYLGYGMLTYKTLQSFSKNQQPQEKNKEGILTPEEEEEKENQILNIDILKRWLIFIAFLLFEPFLFAIAELVPFGLSFVLIMKILIIYPHVLIHLYLYKLLENLELDNYAENKIFIYISTLLKEVIIFTLDLISEAVKYVNLGELREIEQHIDKINEKIGFKMDVCQKRNSLLSDKKSKPQNYQSCFSFRKSAF